MPDLMLTDSGRTTTVAVREIDYPALCRQFVEQARGLDDKIMAGLFAASTVTTPDSPNGKLLGGAVVKVFGHHVQAIGVTSRQLAWATAANLPGQWIKDVAARRIDDHHEGYAESRAALLTHFFGPQVAQILPEDLKTPDAAAYMRGKKRPVLANLIESAIG